MSAPHVYRAINAISRTLSRHGIAKRHRNIEDDYLYRSVDDVLNRLSPLLARHKLCVLPHVLERTATDRVGLGEQLLVNVALKVGFDLVSATDGSMHRLEAFGEALDASDKATVKAMSSAYKSAMLQAFCVPVCEIADADSSTHRLKQAPHDPQPVEGWEQWAAGIIDIASSCASIEAVDRLQQRQRGLLTSISRERPDLYARIGQAVGDQRASLAGGTGQPGSSAQGNKAGQQGDQLRDAQKQSRPRSARASRTKPLSPSPSGPVSDAAVVP